MCLMCSIAEGYRGSVYNICCLINFFFMSYGVYFITEGKRHEEADTTVCNSESL